MGLLGSIGKAFSGVIKQVAPSIIKAVAPAATKLLKGIVGDTFKAGGSFLTKLAGNLPGPLAGLAQKLLGKALPKLQSLAEGGLEKLIQKLATSITQRFAPGAGNVSLPGITDPARTTAMAANSPAPATASNTGAQSAAPAAAAQNTQAAGGTGSTGGSSGASGAPTSPPDPKNYGDLQDQNNMQRLLKDQQAYQTAFSAMQNYWSMISNIMKANFDTLKGMAQNLR
jgi:hypothetical protein